MDPRLLKDCERARTAVRAAEEGVAKAKADFERAVRRLYVEGASTREIAAALDLSHQRVHQLVGAEPRSWWQRFTGAQPQPVRGCSFCGKSTREVAKLVAGPSVHICGDCIEIAVGLTGAGADGDRRPFQRLPAQSLKRCSFCGKRGRNLGRVAARGHQICATCAGLAGEIAAASKG